MSRIPGNHGCNCGFSTYKSSTLLLTCLRRISACSVSEKPCRHLFLWHQSLKPKETSCCTRVGPQGGGYACTVGTTIVDCKSCTASHSTATKPRSAKKPKISNGIMTWATVAWISSSYQQSWSFSTHHDAWILYGGKHHSNLEAEMEYHVHCFLDEWSCISIQHSVLLMKMQPWACTGYTIFLTSFPGQMWSESRVTQVLFLTDSLTDSTDTHWCSRLGG